MADATYKCTHCATQHEIAGYAVAQLAMGNSVQHKCDCGAAHRFNSLDFKPQLIKPGTTRKPRRPHA